MNRILLFTSVLLLITGALLANRIQTVGGDVRVEDVRFTDSDGRIMSGLLYVPAGASRSHRRPAVLAVHGYINSRETQSPFAIEFARRGYVVLALDQTGHGFSEPPAFAAGFGGPAGLAYLRSLPFVDTDNIGLEGHSMGGWAVLSAAAAMPDDYRAIVLQGSTTGLFGTQEGTATWPRNVAIVFSRWDEFAELMWGVRRGIDVVTAPKLKALFGTTDDVDEGRLYGNPSRGTARQLYVPATTHPGDHLSTAAVAAALDWFDTTLSGGERFERQTWWWKEVGTAMVLCGLVLLIPSVGGWLLRTPAFRPLATPRTSSGDAGWRTVLQLSLVPVLTYLPAYVAAERWLPPNSLWPQPLTNGLMVWLSANALITAATLVIARSNTNARELGFSWSDGFAIRRVGHALLLAVAVVGAAYVALWSLSAVFTVDARFWVVAAKPLAPWHAGPLLAYLPLLVVFFVLLGAAANPLLSGDSTARASTRLAATLTGGFVLFLLVQYVPLLAGAELPLGQPLFTIVAIQFVALLAFVAVNIAVFNRATGTVYVGAVVNALFIGWIVVAGQATAVA